MSPEFILRASISRIKAASNHLCRRKALKELDTFQTAQGYAEPGYDDPKKTVLLGDWSCFPQDVIDLLERTGHEIVWSHDWSKCEGCDKAVRIVPESDTWKLNSVLTDGHRLCLDCFLTDEVRVGKYLNARINDPFASINISGIDLEALGFAKVDSYQHGTKPHRMDSPEDIFLELNPDGLKKLIVQVDSVSKHSVSFSVWEKYERIFLPTR